MKKIIFVCLGNICRSFVIEVITVFISGRSFVTLIYIIVGGSGIVFASARPVGHGVGRAHIFGPDGCDVEASLLTLENHKAAAACMEIVDDFGKEVFEVFLCAVDGRCVADKFEI